VFYEMLTGKRAFDGKNQLARMLAVVKHSHVPLRSHLPEVSAEIEAVIERCLAKTPADRYADGSELLAALEKLVRANVPASSPDPSSEWLRLASDLDGTGPRLPAMPSSRTGIAPAQRDGSSAPTRSFSNETPAPSTQSQRIHPRHPTSAPQHWPLLAAAGGGLLVAFLVIALSTTSFTSARVRSSAGAASPRAAVISGARELGGEREAPSQTGTLPAAVEAEPAASDEESSSRPGKDPNLATVTPVALTARPAPRTDKRPSSFTRLPNDPPPAEVAITVTPPPPAPPPPAPPHPVAAPKTGTIRFPGAEVLTVVVDGEHHRLRNESVTLPCGRHRVRVGLNGERIVEVPCGGSVSF
jgi:serine/threonine-protein kinase